MTPQASLLFFPTTADCRPKLPSSRGGRSRACDTLQRRPPLDPSQRIETQAKNLLRFHLQHTHSLCWPSSLRTYGVHRTAFLDIVFSIHLDAVKPRHAKGVVLAAETAIGTVLSQTRQGGIAAMLGGSDAERKYCRRTKHKASIYRDDCTTPVWRYELNISDHPNWTRVQRLHGRWHRSLLPCDIAISSRPGIPYLVAFT